MFWQQRCYRS